MSSPPSGFEWSSPEGKKLARALLRQHTPYYDPYDYQLNGVYKCLDGVDLLAVIATGCGKTGYFAMYIFVQPALSRDPTICNPP